MIIKPPDSLAPIIDYRASDYSAIKKKVNSDYLLNASTWQQFWVEANYDSNLEAGLADGMGTFWRNDGYNNAHYYFNTVRAKVSLIDGIQRQKRKSSIVVPKNGASERGASQWTDIIMSLWQQNNVYDKISEAFRKGPLITGMSLIYVYIDFSSDLISGDAKFKVYNSNEFFIDPYWKTQDLSDCDFISIRTMMAPSDAAELVPDKYNYIMGMSSVPAGGNRDGKFNFNPESYGMSQKALFTYDEYFYKSTRKQRLLIDKEILESIDVSADSDEKIQEYLDTYPQLYLNETEIPTIRKAILVQDNVVYDGPSGLDRYPFALFLGYFNSSLPLLHSKVQGVVRSLRAQEELHNRYLKTMGQVIESQIKTGWIVKEEAPLDFKYLNQDKFNNIIPIKKNSTMDDIRQIQSVDINPGLFQFYDILTQQGQEITGLNQEVLGLNDDPTVAGITTALRQSAGVMGLTLLFDQLDYSQNMLAEITMDIVRNNYIPSKIKLLLGGEEPVEEFYSSVWAKYNCTVQEGFNTTTQRQLEFAQLWQLKQLGMPGLEEALVNSATIQNKDKILQKINQQQENANKTQLQQLEQAQALNQAQIDMMVAKSMSDKGSYAQKMSSLNKDILEGEKSLVEMDRVEDQALLDKARAIKELEGININHINQIISTLSMLEGLHKQRTNIMETIPQGEPNQPMPSMVNNQQQTAITGNNISPDMINANPIDRGLNNLAP